MRFLCYLCYLCDMKLFPVTSIDQRYGEEDMKRIIEIIKK